MIRIVLEERGDDPLYCPQTFCDECNQRIDEATEGNYLWDPDHLPAKAYHVHKTCTRSFEHRYGKHLYAADLEEFPTQVAANMHSVLLMEELL